MENASKALIIAGEVLISIIIISALVLMFNNLTSYQNVSEQNEQENEVIQFNTRYEAYNRDDVRGNDLYSLINRVVDYNERKTEVGIEGSEFAYQPITINVNLQSEDGKNESEFKAPDGTLRIFKTGSKFTINSTNHTFKKLFSDKLSPIESNYAKGVLNNLATGLTRIFITDDEFRNYLDNDIEKAKQIIYNYNSAYGSAQLSADNDNALRNSWIKIKEGSQIREDVYTYYEYLQFTRAHFKCTGVRYNAGTGRIIEMNFQFTGKIN